MVAAVYLLDTNIIAEPLKLNPNKNVIGMLQKHDGQLASATLVLHEIKFGVNRLPHSKKRKFIEAYIEKVVLPGIPFFDYTKEAAVWHASERARLVSSGKTPSFVDGQIASIAKVHELVVVTRNVADFKSFKGLRVVNWFE